MRMQQAISTCWRSRSRAKLVPQDVAAFENGRAFFPHRRNRGLDALRIDAAAGIFDETDIHTGQHVEGIEHRKTDAIIGGKAADVELRDTLTAQIVGQSRRRALIIVAKGGIAVDGGVFALLLNIVEGVRLEVGMKFRIRRALHAMVRPHHLRLAGEFAHVEGFLAGMLGGEAAVIFRVPVLRGDDEIVAAIVDQGIGDGHDPVAIGNGQIAARAKTVLDIDEQQRLHDVPPFSGQDAKPALTDQAPFDLSGRHGCLGRGLALSQSCRNCSKFPAKSEFT
ncbi:hypothetical protein AGR7B_Cc160030 [Agrobacterium deltaense RV3]|nr:hypothetical protein AGR7B_Cc160030 [Agrobacterium deltaense RV3]